MPMTLDKAKRRATMARSIYKPVSDDAMALRVLFAALAAAEKQVAHLNAKLDATHEHRCFACEGTVTPETSARQQAALDKVRADAIEEAFNAVHAVNVKMLGNAANAAAHATRVRCENAIAALAATTGEKPAIVRYDTQGNVWLDRGDAPSAPPPGAVPTREPSGATTWHRPDAPGENPGPVESHPFDAQKAIEDARRDERAKVKRAAVALAKRHADNLRGMAGRYPEDSPYRPAILEQAQGADYVSSWLNTSDGLDNQIAADQGKPS